MRTLFAFLAGLVLAASAASAADAASPAKPAGPGGAALVTAPAPVARADALTDLPVVEYPVAGDPGPWMAVHLTGDGGVGVTDKGIGKELSASGIPVVVLNSLKYFMTRRTPAGAAQDLARILRHYLAAWNRERVVIVGYSMGADVLPFLISRLPPDLRSRIGLVVFIGQAGAADFHIHLSAFFGVTGKDALPVRPELEKLRGMKMLGFYGEHDGNSICRGLPADLVACTEMKGGHRVGGEYEGITQSILAGIGR